MAYENLWFKGYTLRKPSILKERAGQLWQDFIDQEKLSSTQADQFEQFLLMLLDWSEKINLTTITNLKSIIAYHFQDSLSLGHATDVHKISSLADVGTGGGFPGIPLKIKYPHLHIVLIEVKHKRRVFLQEVIHKLKLEGIEIYPHDWRTFLRKTEMDIDMVCARASLQPSELMRMFKPSSPYKDATLVYWAAKDWEPEKKELPFIKQSFDYQVGRRKRKLIFFALP